MLGRIEQNIIDKINNQETLHMTLIDPDKTKNINYVEIAREAEKGGTHAIMVGGSTIASNLDIDKCVKEIKKNIDIPVILFPNGTVGITPAADAIWFMSLLNSLNPYYFIDCQALAAPVIKRYKLEAIPMAYIIIGSGGAAGYVGQARKISYNQPELVLGYSLAAELLGIRFVYLEAGSGAKEPIPREMISLIKKHIKIPIIIGGGIKNPEAARVAKNAGADIIVTGTLIEEKNIIQKKISEIVTSLKNLRL
jgi:phosphoglycerol geranylgeranyltransferase